VAELLRFGKDWCLARNGKKSGAVQARSKCTNWYHPFLWTSIDNAMRKNAWSATYTVKQLQRDQPKLFSKITKGVIQKWIGPSKCAWSDATVKNIACRHALVGSGQAGILAKHTEIRDEIKTQLQALRTSGLAVNVLIAQSIMIAIIQTQAPNLLTKFKCSEVRIYLKFMDLVLIVLVGICPFIPGKCDGLDLSKRHPQRCPLACECQRYLRRSILQASIHYEVE
jgi:hypothetical protein